jgi:DNA-binding beta-propeller fold protein YncE
MSNQEITSAIFALTPSESKRLIARAVAALPEVRRAMERGRIIIANGTTNAFVAEELLGIPVPKVRFAAGIISQGWLGTTNSEERLPPYVLRDGQPIDVPMREALAEFEAHDVFIKGGNAVDPQGNVGVLMGHERGGTIGSALGIVVARGAHLIAPVGLEKLIASVPEAARRCGQLRQRYHLGMAVGLMPLVNARLITEVQALEILAGAQAIHVASGGINGSEGAVVLVAEGPEEEVARAFRLVEGIKGEPPVRI